MGRAFAWALAERGMYVAIHHAHSGEAAAEFVRDVESMGGRAAAFEGDLTDIDVVRSLPVQVAAELGGLDVLVNSAAVMERIPFDSVTLDEWEGQLQLNLRAPFFLAQQAAPFLRQNSGTIVNITDLSAFEPWPSYPVHSISKAGVVMLTQVLATALAPDITVNAIAPGTVLLPESYDDARRSFLAETTPLRRLGSPEDAVHALLYLVEHATFVTGETMVVDGGRLLRR